MATKDEQADDFLKGVGAVRRADWGAAPPKTALDPDWDYTVVALHHSGHSGETDPRAVQRKHTDQRGWDDVGYHLMVNPAGTVYEGRRLTAKGSHIGNQNTGKVGLLVMGDFEGWSLPFLGKGPPTAAQLAAVRKLVPALKRLFPGIAVLGGHRDWDGNTECPGRHFYPLLAGLRTEFALGPPPGVK